MPSRLATTRTLSAIALAVITLEVIASVASAAESYRFTRRPAALGDRATQSVEFGLKVSMVMHQSGQVIEQADRDMRRKQTRTMEVLEINDGLVTKASVRYEASEESVIESDGATARVEHPVVGKTYLVSRPDGEGADGEGAELVVTDLQGNVPPPEELAIVQSSMDSVGRTNPWTNFLAGQTLTQGEAVRMPNHLAADLFGVGEAVGDVSYFEVTLAETRQVRGATCAVLEAKIEAKSPLGTGVEMLVSGKFLVEIDTCRTLAIELSGDVAVVETHGPAGGEYTVEGKGTMRVAIEAQYGSARARTTSR